QGGPGAAAAPSGRRQLMTRGALVRITPTTQLLSVRSLSTADTPGEGSVGFTENPRLSADEDHRPCEGRVGGKRRGRPEEGQQHIERGAAGQANTGIRPVHDTQEFL